MYESFYQLTTNPFRLAPDPNFCFSHSGYKRAREYLEYALDQGEGFVLVTGRPGTGKTLLLETFLKGLDTSNVVARRIAVSNYAGDDLLRAVAYAYDIDAADLDKATLRHRIHQYFIEQEQAGRRVLLIIDEAQALQHTALEELRILADLQTQSRLMLQLFLVGQESLQDLMHSPDMEQFQQRVIANYHLVPLSLIEARAYIEYRLLHAGWNGDPEFSSAAVLAIYQLSKGVPRHINKICNRLLLLGFGKGCHAFDEEDVQTISAEMREEQLTPMESDRIRFANTESITNIPEIRDGLVSIDDLAIRADQVDAEASAISAASRLAASKNEQFIDRRHNDPAAWNVQHSSSANPVAELVAEQNLSLFRWRETVVATAAILAITTISIAALPSILGETAGNDRQSRTDHQAREIQDTAGTGLLGSFDDELTTDEVVVVVTTDSVEFRVPTSDADEDEVIPDMQEDGALVATSEAADTTTVTVESRAVPVVIASVSWVDEPEEKKSLVSEMQVAVAAVSEHADTIDVDYLSPVGNIERNVLSEEEQQAMLVGSIQPIPFAETVATLDTLQDETIKVLLSQGKMSLDSFRLLTPEDDNAYGYYRAVLLLDPDNEDASEGIQEIVNRYITLTRKAAGQHENARAKRYIKRGLSVQPYNRDLLVLEARIDRKIEMASIAMAPVARSMPVSQGTVSSKEQSTQDSMIQGIKTFFKKRQAEGRSGVVNVPTGWDS
jgi:type II secretory pathway predicted ATPase ExeA